MKYFNNTNIKRNAAIQVYGLHHLNPLKLNKYFANLFYNFLYFLEIINFYILKKLNIPQIEFALTTNCNLKCQYCLNYIPYLNKDEQKNINFEDFKIQIDNLTNAVNKIYNLLLLGGEPLLVKDLPRILDYAARNKKIKKIWIYSNGTIIPSDELVKVMNLHKKKLICMLSNYSSNKEIAYMLKYDLIIKKLKENNINYIFKTNLKWGFISVKIKNSNRSREQNTNYYLQCLQECTSVFDGNIFVCPRAGVFYLKHLYEFEENEQISLKNQDKNLKNKLIKFYDRNYFGACNFCTFLEDNLKNNITPAYQIK